MASHASEKPARPSLRRSLRKRSQEPRFGCVCEPRSTSVIPVNRDVLFGQIARKHAVAALAEPERDFKADFGALHRRGNRRLIVTLIARASMGDANAAEPDRQPVAIGGLAGFADSHDDAAPV